MSLRATLATHPRRSVEFPVPTNEGVMGLEERELQVHALVHQPLDKPEPIKLSRVHQGGSEALSTLFLVRDQIVEVEAKPLKGGMVYAIDGWRFPSSSFGRTAIRAPSENIRCR